MKNLLLTLLLVSFFFIQKVGANCTSTGTGNWSDASSWTCDVGSVPGCSDTITILVGHDITVDVQTDLSGCGPIHIIILGTLSFKTGNKLLLPLGSTIDLQAGGTIVPGGGSGSSNYIEIGGNPVWTAGDGTATGPLYYTDLGALPVELISFDCEWVDDVIKLSWVSVSEINNDYYLIEHSSDGHYWVMVTTVSGAGNSNQILEYDRIHYEPVIGYNYYRLTQFDYNGISETFNVIVCKKDINEHTSRNLIKVVNIFGQEVKEDYIGVKVLIYDDGYIYKVVGN